jgi:voltage-gated potassium channel
MRRGRHVFIGFVALAGIVVVGTVGYVVLGLGLLDALYQTVTTITTVGFREVQPLDDAGQLFTIVLILAGVGTALYTLTVGLELIVEGHLGAAMEKRRMEKRIEALQDHVILCGWGRVGRAIARELAEARRELVIVDNDPERVATIEFHPFVLGDATSDDVLRLAGIERAAALVAALSTDAENLFITLSGRALRPDLFIVARAREESSTEKLTRAGADRVVNPQEIGGARMAAFLLHPHVTEFLDVVMRDRSIELRLEEVPVAGGSPFVGQTLRRALVRERTGALILALRHVDGTFLTNPDPDTELVVGQILIAIGTDAQLRSLVAAAASPGANPAAKESADPVCASSASRSRRPAVRPSSQGEV